MILFLKQAEKNIGDESHNAFWLEPVELILAESAVMTAVVGLC